MSECEHKAVERLIGFLRANRVDRTENDGEPWPTEEDGAGYDGSLARGEG